MSSRPKYINRELSWLEFNQRVLDEACDAGLPLLERLKFLAITAANLDEFFSVRVGGLTALAATGSQRRDPSGLTARLQLNAIGRRAAKMTRAQYTCYAELEPLLAAQGIRRLRPSELNPFQQSTLTKLFNAEIFPILTPIALTVERERTLLANQRLHMLVRLGPACEEAADRYAVIPLDQPIRRFLTLPDKGGHTFMLLEDAVAHHVDRLFPGEPILECATFRITRNADLSVREDLATDLLSEMEEVLDARKQSKCVRLELSDSASDPTREFLIDHLEVEAAAVHAVPGPLDLSAYFALAGLTGFDALRDEAWPPQPSPAVDPSRPIFETIREQDVLIHTPYESFEPVVMLLQQAAEDPDVLAIKQILYRTSKRSPVVAALERAAERGKAVSVVVELKARFDEARNIEWARALEQAGVQVVYGVRGLKTHAKMCLVIRREPTGIQRYMHFGTGNYNEQTARLYGDVSLMTCDEELARDVSTFFNTITGYSQPQRFRKLEMAPTGLREKLLEQIRVETERGRQGHTAAITAKMNSLVDPEIIDALYEASAAGVVVRLNIRGICCLRPGVKGLSDRIHVVSIIDRFLEHSRIFCFHHGGERRVYFSSADWMPRNLDKRIELLVPVEDPLHQKRLVDILELYFADNVKAHKLGADGRYRRLKPKSGKRPIRSQEQLYREAVDEAQKAIRSRQTEFEPHTATSTT